MHSQTYKIFEKYSKIMLLLYMMLFISLLFSVSFSFKKPRFGSNSQDRYYDFVVVGSGPTGSMLSIGLANKGYTVLLMEAGPDYISEEVTTPAFHLKAAEEPKMSWDFYVKHYPEKTNRRQKVLYPRVSALGGCTLHNALIHVYPSASDFEHMVKLTGDSSWTESEMRNYFDKMTSSSDSTIEKTLLPINYRILTSVYSSITKIFDTALEKDGWLPLTLYSPTKLIALDTKLFDVISNILYGFANLYLLNQVDINGYKFSGLANSQEGDYLMPMNVDGTTWKRKGIYEHLKSTAAKNKNLQIMTNAFVTKILLNNNNDRARGVSYKVGKYLYRASPLSNSTNHQHLKTRHVYARKEVIISAGTFNTPQLMMLSGIGDTKALRNMGIVPKVHLPGVGRNLQDRYEIALNYQFQDEFTILSKCQLDTRDECFSEYKDGKGVYAFNGVLLANLAKSKQTLKEPDLVSFHIPFYFNGYKKGMTKDLLKHKDIYSIFLLKAHTKNTKGRVTLTSSDPRDPPNINFNYFAEGAKEDINALIKGVREGRKVASRLYSNIREVNPGSNLETDKQLKEYIENHSWGHHACCTMKIGRENDRMSVLDRKFRVKGVKNLRVADMSIFNKIPGYFPVLYLYMAGAKIADTIAIDHN